jgi:hypothetical protein
MGKESIMDTKRRDVRDAQGRDSHVENRPEWRGREISICCISRRKKVCL